MQSYKLTSRVWISPPKRTCLHPRWTPCSSDSWSILGDTSAPRRPVGEKTQQRLNTHPETGCLTLMVWKWNRLRIWVEGQTPQGFYDHSGKVWSLRVKRGIEREKRPSSRQMSAKARGRSANEIQNWIKGKNRAGNEQMIQSGRSGRCSAWLGDFRPYKVKWPH